MPSKKFPAYFVVIIIGLFTVTGARGANRERVLHTFTGKDGAVPLAGLVSDTAGNFYATTLLGGA
jgi:hypothetical protein